MGNQNNNINDTNKSDNTQEDKFGQAIDFCVRNVRYIAVAGLFVVLVIVLAKGLKDRNGGNQDRDLPVASTESLMERARRSCWKPSGNAARILSCLKAILWKLVSPSKAQRAYSPRPPPSAPASIRPETMNSRQEMFLR